MAFGGIHIGHDGAGWSVKWTNCAACVGMPVAQSRDLPDTMARAPGLAINRSILRDSPWEGAQVGPPPRSLQLEATKACRHGS